MIAIETETAIIGGGQAGVPLARALASAGRGVVLIEREHLGGSCVNFGCTPSKALIASARMAAAARRAGELGIRISEIEVDFAAVMDRVRSIVLQSTGELNASFEGESGVRLIGGHARLAGRENGRFVVRVDDTHVLAERVVLDTGTRSVVPPIPGLDQVRFIDAENWVGLRERPGRLLVLGGGIIAMEMSQAFQRLGTDVTVVQKGGQVLDGEEAEVAEAMRAALERDGCRVLLGTDVRHVERSECGVRLRWDGGEADGTHLFVAVGRRPNTDDLGLETLGIGLSEQGYVVVDDCLRTSVPGVWAGGDIRGGPAFTHAAYDDYRVLESQFLGNGEDSRCRIVPYAVFTDPELGRVGMSEAEARSSGRAVRIGRRMMTDSGKARELGRTDGFIKVVVDSEAGTILGATAFCEQGSELVQLFVELMNADATVETMRGAVHIHPTLAEAAKNAALAAWS